MKNRDGFTLTEVIAVVVILGLLVAGVVPTVINYVRENKNQVNLSNVKTLELAAKDYLNENHLLPSINGFQIVLGDALRGNNYLTEELKDAEGGNCSDSFVIVENDGDGYNYKACLICENYNNIKDDEMCKAYNPNPEEDDEGKNDYGDKNFNCKVYFVNEDSFEINDGWINSNESLEFKVEAHSNLGVSKIKVNGKTLSFKQNGTDPDGLKVYNATYNITSSGIYDIKATAVNTKNKEISCSYEGSSNDKIKVDFSKPDIVFGKSNKNFANKETELEIPIVVTDKVSGIDYEQISENIKNNLIIKVGDQIINPNITIALKDNKYILKLSNLTGNGELSLTLPSGAITDKAGNGNDEIVATYNTLKVLIDNTNPVCSVTQNAPSNYTNNNVVVKWGCSDDGAGCAHNASTITKTYKEEGSTTSTNYYVVDRAGNEGICPRVTVKIDKTSPECSLSVTDDGVYANKKIVSLNYKDNTGKINNITSSLNFNKSNAIKTGDEYILSGTNGALIENNQTYNATITDEAGNRGKCSITVNHIDKTPPTFTVFNANQSADLNVENQKKKIGLVGAHEISEELSNMVLKNSSGTKVCDMGEIAEGTDIEGIGDGFSARRGCTIEQEGEYTIEAYDNSKIYADKNSILSKTYKIGNKGEKTTHAYLVKFNDPKNRLETPGPALRMEGVSLIIHSTEYNGNDLMELNTKADKTGTSIIAEEVTYGSSAVFEYTLNSDNTLYYIWPTYRITYNGGENCTYKDVDQGNKIGTLCTPRSRSGYRFDGWYTSASGGTKITSDYIPDRNRTIYAHWTRTTSCTLTVEKYPNSNGWYGINNPPTLKITTSGTVGTVKYDIGTTSTGPTLIWSGKTKKVSIATEGTNYYGYIEDDNGKLRCTPDARVKSNSNSNAVKIKYDTETPSITTVTDVKWDYGNGEIYDWHNGTTHATYMDACCRSSGGCGVIYYFTSEDNDNYKVIHSDVRSGVDYYQMWAGHNYNDTPICDWINMDTCLAKPGAKSVGIQRIRAVDAAGNVGQNHGQWTINSNWSCK